VLRARFHNKIIIIILYERQFIKRRYSTRVRLNGAYMLKCKWQMQAIQINEQLLRVIEESKLTTESVTPSSAET